MNIIIEVIFIRDGLGKGTVPWCTMWWPGVYLHAIIMSKAKKTTSFPAHVGKAPTIVAD